MGIGKEGEGIISIFLVLNVFMVVLVSFPSISCIFFVNLMEMPTNSMHFIQIV